MGGAEACPRCVSEGCLSSYFVLGFVPRRSWSQFLITLVATPRIALAWVCQVILVRSDRLVLLRPCRYWDGPRILAKEPLKPIFGFWFYPRLGTTHITIAKRAIRPTEYPNQIAPKTPDAPPSEPKKMSGGERAACCGD